ncbi:hypothetical protein ACFQHW_05405 [Lapidilactobacillus achengensis]|uniref:Uncharacterized protein n=1 Tax=Lapidilactobacillus achengensis TaxID=2486000 RepID=A0ABW1UP90_9LACO|nr:hypothetical protein [Lapidilactobacillus achengensis]
MTVKYQFGDDLTALTDAMAAWRADRNDGRVVVPTGLAPLDDTWQTAAAPDLLAAILQAFLPERDLTELTTLATTALTATWGKRAPIAVTPKRGKLATRYAEMATGLTMSAADWNTALVQSLVDTAQPLALVAHDANALIALAEHLDAGNHLTGYAALATVPPLVQKQFAAASLAEQVTPVAVDETASLNSLTGWQAEQAALSQTTKAAGQVYVPVDGGQLSVLVPQILSYFLIAQQAPAEELTIVCASDDLSEVLAARYAQLLGAPIKRVLAAIGPDSPLAAVAAGAELTTNWPLAKNALRLAASFHEQALPLTSAWADLQTSWSSWLSCAPVTTTAGLREIRRGQTQDQMTLGAQTALASALVQSEQLPDAIVLSTTDPFQTPEAIITGITDRDDGKTDFEAVQILRQIVDLKVPRVITHLKSKELPELPNYLQQAALAQLQAGLNA